MYSKDSGVMTAEGRLARYGRFMRGLVRVL
jgi:hypothetical protein